MYTRGVIVSLSPLSLLSETHTVTERHTSSTDETRATSAPPRAQPALRADTLARGVWGLHTDHSALRARLDRYISIYRSSDVNGWCTLKYLYGCLPFVHGERSPHTGLSESRKCFVFLYIVEYR